MGINSGSFFRFRRSGAVKLAEDGYNIFGVHLDRQVTMPNVERIMSSIKIFRHRSYFFQCECC